MIWPQESDNNPEHKQTGKMNCSKKISDSDLSGYFYYTYMLPPNSFEFKVTMAAPIHTITNTWANSGPPSYCPAEEPCNIVAMNVHSTSGPHRSPKNNRDSIELSTMHYNNLQSFSRLDFSLGYKT